LPAGLPSARTVCGRRRRRPHPVANGRDLRRWAAVRQVSFHFARYPVADVRAAIDTITNERAQAGHAALALATLADIPHAPASSIHPPKRRVGWTRDTLIEGMAIAVRLLGPAGQLSQRSLKRLAASRPDLAIPSYTTVHRHLRDYHPDESWEQWRREAEQRARDGQGGARNA
jgi:hypothetical protein